MTCDLTYLKNGSGSAMYEGIRTIHGKVTPVAWP